MTTRRPGGRETWHRLREWDRVQAESERLAARLLAGQGYEAIDPSHPLGGPDGGKDIVCKRGSQTFVVAVYFPRGQVEFNKILDKFQGDMAKVQGAGESGLVFFTNQELTLSERARLEDVCPAPAVDIYHLERIASCLDSPSGYGLRLEFLSIDMTREEQVSFFNERDQVLYEIRDKIKELTQSKKLAAEIKTVQVEQEDLFSLTSSLFGTRLVECKNCQEVFRAGRASSNFFLHGALETVTCPACGKVQAFR